MQYFCVGAQKLQILAKIMFDKADRKLMVNRMFAVHPIERNHHITLAISFFNDKAFKLYCKDYYLKYP